VPAAAHPSVYNIPINRGFADALATGLLARAKGDRLALARAIVLLPNNRAQRAITDAFVRRAGGGLLLPRLVSIGDPELDDRIGPLFDPASEERVPPAIDPLARQLILARLIGEARTTGPIEPVEAVRLAADLARMLDQMTVEEVDPVRLVEAVPAELSEHWQVSLDLLQIVSEQGREQRRRELDAHHAGSFEQGALRRREPLQLALEHGADVARHAFAQGEQIPGEPPRPALAL